MVVVFTISEINYLMVSPFCDWCGPVHIYVCGIKFFSCTICQVSDIATKAATAFPKSFTIFLKAPIRPSYFKQNICSKFSFAKLLGLCFCVDFSSDFGFYYIVLQYIYIDIFLTPLSANTCGCAHVAWSWHKCRHAKKQVNPK